jgi:hypothetical protein
MGKWRVSDSPTVDGDPAALTRYYYSVFQWFSATGAGLAATSHAIDEVA